MPYLGFIQIGLVQKRLSQLAVACVPFISGLSRFTVEYKNAGGRPERLQ
jgi:hypothetical protein